MRRLRKPSAESPDAGKPAHRDEWRLVLVILAFMLAYGAVGVRMGALALGDPAEPRLAAGGGTDKPVRGQITDRKGRLLAANLPAWSLFARPPEIDDPAATAKAIAPIFPDLKEDWIEKRLGLDSKFVWIKRPVTPRQKQAVMDLDPAQPALKFGRRDMRIYPAGHDAAHIVGGVQAEDERVLSASLVGRAGVEYHFDARLRDPAQAGEPLALSIDLAVQSALRDVLAEGVSYFGAKAASAVLLNVHTGEVIAMVSLPDFDPNEPLTGPAGGAESPRFNRAVLGRYELGSVFKPVTAAIALETGVATPDTMVDTQTPLTYGRRRIRDIHRMPPALSLTDIVVRSSNLGSARLAMRANTKRFKVYLRQLGLFDALPVELSEAPRAVPLLPRKWIELTTMTASYGHGIAISPMHLASAYATLANGGRVVRPTLQRGGRALGPRVFSERTATQMLQILRQVVERGTGRRAEVKGYEIGGKTGTADKPKPGGGYYAKRVIATFASIFPVSQPAYALVIMLDEPTDPQSGMREASRTAVPVTGKAVQRIAPILGLRPRPAQGGQGAPALAVGIAQ